MEERLKELANKLANGEITKEQYDQMLSQLQNPFETGFLEDWTKMQQSSGIPLNTDNLSPAKLDYGKRLQEMYAGSGILKEVPKTVESTTQQGNLVMLPQTEGNTGQTTTSPAPANQPFNFFEANYNKDGIPDYLQDTNFGKVDETKTEETTKTLDFNDAFSKYLPFMNPYGTDIGTELYSLGKFIGTDKGTKGRGLGIASSAISAGLGGARALLSGLAAQKQTEFTADEIRRQMALKNYTPQTMYLNQNNRGK